MQMKENCMCFVDLVNGFDSAIEIAEMSKAERHCL